METLVLDLTNPQSRENALLELSKKRESFPELAPYLWHSFGTISALLQVSSSAPAHPWARVGPTPVCGRSSLTRLLFPSAGDRQHLPAPDAASPHGTRLQPRVQCPGAPTVRRVPPGDAQPIPPGYAASRSMRAATLITAGHTSCNGAPLPWRLSVSAAATHVRCVLC